MDSKPDHSCFVGPNETGCDFYIWNCINNQKVVIYQCGIAFAMPSAKQENSNCNSLTSFEEKYSIDTNNLDKCKKSMRPWP